MHNKDLSKLKEARLAAGYSIQQVADHLNIKKQYLVALEEGDLQVIPGEVYAEGYLKIYSKYLGVQIANLDEEPKVIPRQIKIQVGKNFKKYLSIICGMMLIITIITYRWLINNETGNDRRWSEIQTGYDTE